MIKKSEDKFNVKNICLIFFLAYLVIIALFYFAAGEQLYFRDSKHNIVSGLADIATPEVTPDFTVKQSFFCEMSRIKSFSVQFATYARNNTGHVNIELKDDTNQTSIVKRTIDVSTLTDAMFIQIDLDKPVPNVFGHTLSISISSNSGSSGNAVGPLYQSNLNSDNKQLYFNDEPVNGVLCFNVNGDDDVWTGSHYWRIMSAFGIILLFYCWNLIWREKKGKKSIGLYVINILKKYKFLIKQLVTRDFKIKYKRSVFGALWSFVNPLLTMTVQYYVFSTIFKTNIEHYQVYLLSGLVLFGFFQEATGASIGAIVGNASLITKVYVPKYIYPVSKVMSSAVNLVISLSPLLIITIASHVRITKAWIIIPFILICLLIFCIGMGFILSAAMVFFRDIQFIWSVISMVWMYLTPIFYPESILPENMRWVLHYNPMYNFINFFRLIVIKGISPEPIMYLKCMGFSLLFLLLGIIVFKKGQDRFVFYI